MFSSIDQNQDQSQAVRRDPRDQGHRRRSRRVRGLRERTDFEASLNLRSVGGLLLENPSRRVGIRCLLRDRTRRIRGVLIRDNQFRASSKRGGAFPERPSARVRSFSSLSFLQVVENRLPKGLFGWSQQLLLLGKAETALGNRHRG